MMGSDSDLPVMAECARILDGYGLAYDMRVLSAHRTPDETVRFVRRAERGGCKVIIAGAGASAHLAGVVAAHSLLPVIGVPLAGSPLGGVDALLSTVQMPPGVPVATMGVGAMGARNAAHLTASILALGDARLRAKLAKRRRRMRDDVVKKNRDLPARLAKLLKAK